jgi:hypothetical protein
MANPDGELTVAQRLGRALDRGLLPAGGPAEAAERLIERLERPARIALLGLPGAGKSSILNLLVGSIVVPETLRLPTIIVQHGDMPRMVCTLTDGTTQVVPGADLSQVLPLAPALVTLEMDLPALRVISLLEVSAGPMEAEQKRAATWASKRADIVIWCTTSYLPKEQAVWESLPDSVKDNSFMFLTKVDLLGNREAAQAMHDRVELRAGEEFRQILSISAKQARAAMPPGGTVNRDLFRDSGAGAVITAIKTRVQSGRRADMDTAELLLARHVEASELVAKRFAEAEEGEAKSWSPPPEPEPATPDPREESFSEAAAVIEAAAPDAEMDPGFEIEPEFEAQPEIPPSAPVEESARTDPEPEPQPVSTAPAPAAEPEQEPDSGTRRRFADRIKRVASDADPNAAPAMPLRTTWKSKAETEAAPPPVPEPEAAREPTRRPRTGVAVPVEDPAEAAPEPVEPEPVEAESTIDAAAIDEPMEEVDPGPGSPSVRAERPARTMTPRPELAQDAPRMARPQLFGGRRPAAGFDSRLPDLSSLRATPEEMEAALSEDTPDTDEVPAEVPVPVARSERAVERPRLFDREARVPPAEPEPAPSPEPRAAPVSRLPRIASSAVPQSTPSPVAASEDQFSPAAIMRREPRANPDTPAPRRERPRIAARAVPVPVTEIEAAPASPVERNLVDEAIGVIVARSAELSNQIDPEAKVPVDLILDHARETGELVQAVVSRGRSDELRRINIDIGEVMDLIMLMQLEKGHAPADDALTLILQLKRELETLSAA